ncbi:hypothetical protein [Brevibacterium moorei]|uniref:hypothetical protein n=1 Tax=Brevibacterium moorei TaxID=2968457 RepID=UPI00211CB7C8|nr:hypothetical protein [Brevibacterium sp. 68QC2CO]MCQ9385420.1 hypothetical protein [Brevibacterium sp. 68QC2CO]
MKKMEALTHEALKLAVWMAEHGVSSAKVSDGDLALENKAAAEQKLFERGVVSGEKDLTGQRDVHLKPGQDVVLRRKANQVRRDEIGLGILAVLEEDRIGGSADELAAHLAGAVRPAVSVGECEQEVQELEEMGMVKVLASWGVPLVRSSIERRGRRCLESGYGPEDFDKVEGNHMGTNINNNFTGSSIAAVSQGDHNTLNTQQNVNTDLQTALDIVAGIRAKVAEAAPEQAELVDGIEDGLKTGKGKKFISALGTGLAGALGGELGQWVFEQIQTLLALPLFG